MCWLSLVTLECCCCHHGRTSIITTQLAGFFSTGSCWKWFQGHTHVQSSHFFARDWQFYPFRTFHVQTPNVFTLVSQLPFAFAGESAFLFFCSVIYSLRSGGHFQAQRAWPCEASCRSSRIHLLACCLGTDSISLAHWHASSLFSSVAHIGFPSGLPLRHWPDWDLLSISRICILRLGCNQLYEKRGKEHACWPVRKATALTLSLNTIRKRRVLLGNKVHLR